MHIQPLFAEPQCAELHRLIRAYPLATLVTVGAHGSEANLLPLELVEGGAHGRLRGHVGKTHALFTGTVEGSEALAVFQGPNAYISPRWYVNGQRSGRVAPSWNYVAVQARGPIRFVEDGRWLLAHLAALAAAQEAHRDPPWSLAEASPQFIEEATQHLVGFEVDIVERVGKRFLSQQRTEADRQSIVRHLAGEASGAARDLAALIEP